MARCCPYDRLAVAPGIDIKFDSVPGYSEAASRAACRMPGRSGRRRNCSSASSMRWRTARLIVMVRAAQSLSLPARTLRARLDDGACAQGQGPQEARRSSCSIRSRISRKQALFEEGWEKHYPGMIEWQDPKMHGGIKERRSEDHDGEDRSRRLQGAARQRDPGADGRQDRARRRACQRQRLLPDQAGKHEVGERSQHLHRRRCLHRRATCRNRLLRPTARPRSRR